MSPREIGHRIESMRRSLIFVMQAAAFAVSVAIAFFLRFDLSSPVAETGHLVFAFIACLGMKNIEFQSTNLDRDRSIYIFNPLVCLWPTVLVQLDQESSPNLGATRQPAQNERLSMAQACDGALDCIQRLASSTLTFPAFFKSLYALTVSPMACLHSQGIMKAKVGVERGRSADGIYELRSQGRNSYVDAH